MPIASNRELIQITSQAYRHMKKAIGALKRKGIPTSGTRWVSELILAQDIPTNGNNHSAAVAAAVPVHEEEK
jgi:hypothetical protein